MEKSRLRKLVDGCAINDRKCQEQLYRHFFDAMYRMCHRYAGDEDTAMILLNDGFLKVFQKIHTFKHEGSLEGWVRKLVFHAISDHYRKKRNQVKFIEIGARDRFSREDEVITGLYLEDLLEMIHQLPDSSRAVFELYAVEGYTHAEIGEKMGISDGTSKWHLSNARKLLKALIKKQQENLRTHAG